VSAWKFTTRGRHREGQVWTGSKWEKQSVEQTLSRHLPPPHRRSGPSSSELSIYQQEVSTPYLWRSPTPKATQRAKLFKRIDCLNCPSLRPQLECNSAFLMLYPYQPGQEGQRNGLLIDKKYKHFCLFFFLSVFCFVLFICCCYCWSYLGFFFGTLFLLNQFIHVWLFFAFFLSFSISKLLISRDSHITTSYSSFLCLPFSTSVPHTHSPQYSIFSSYTLQPVLSSKIIPLEIRIFLP
jgi:hypothetical protein